MKKLMLFTLLVSATYALCDDITFSFIQNGAGVNLTSTAAGMTATDATNLAVSDTALGLEFPLTGFTSASTGPPSSVVITPTSYLAAYSSGGSVTITEGGVPILTGSPMFDMSHLSSNLSEDTGSFAGEFTVTSVSPAILGMFGLGPKFKPDGSISITFAESNVVGAELFAVIGGGSVTIETPAPVPEVRSILLLVSGLVTLGAFARARGRLRHSPR